MLLLSTVVPVALVPRLVLMSTVKPLEADSAYVTRLVVAVDAAAEVANPVTMKDSATASFNLLLLVVPDALRITTRLASTPSSVAMRLSIVVSCPSTSLLLRPSIVMLILTVYVVAGVSVGATVGAKVGCSEGAAVGFCVGIGVGAYVGFAVGTSVGL